MDNAQNEPIFLAVTRRLYYHLVRIVSYSMQVSLDATAEISG